MQYDFTYIKYREQANSQTQEVDKRLPEAGGERDVESYCLIVTVSIWNDEKLLEINSGDGCTTS